MVRRSRSRLLIPLIGTVLATALTACSLGRAESAEDPRPTPGGAAAGLPAPDVPTTVSAGQVALLQKLGADGPLRTLRVEPDGTWKCIDCAGDGVTSAGSLDPEQASRLQQMLVDPRLAKETDEARRYRATCIDSLTSSLLTAAGLVTWQDCPGEERPPAAGEILLLLTQATPAELEG
ncbi:hypothetical protein [Micromonospora sp. WMMD812]|uniref:hypothetical protein n=1 Tax=Micromonospora sp. WMMD812 TaxID=3015152 RepID=UPI00248B1FD4|nr:hypothetical protein [Micromonospora sp. WMMD812]WBB66169.1 hypothetical protein O7603_23790 [Micromonospora sp. WMMD812]